MIKPYSLFFFKFVIINGPFSHLVMPKIYFNINISKVFFCVRMFIFSWLDNRKQQIRLSDVIIAIWLFSKHHCWYLVIITKYLTVKVRVLCKYYSKSCLFIIDCHFFFHISWWYLQTKTINIHRVSWDSL